MQSLREVYSSENEWFDFSSPCCKKPISDYLGLNRWDVVLFVYSGELVIKEGRKEVTIKEGESVFLRGRLGYSFRKTRGLKEGFCGVYMGLRKSFLRRFYKNLDEVPFVSEGFEKGAVKLPRSVYLESLYVSIIPYVKSGVKPAHNILYLKQLECVYCLLLTDVRFYKCLFNL